VSFPANPRIATYAEYISLPAYDRMAALPHRLHNLDRIRTAVDKYFEVDAASKKTGALQICLVERGCGSEYQKITETQDKVTRRAGALRSIPNSDVLLSEMTARWPNTTRVTLEDMPLKEKVNLFKNMDVVIMQSGSAIVNAIFMQSGAYLIHLSSFSPLNMCYEFEYDVCKSNEIELRVISQRGNHVPVNVSQVMRVLEKIEQDIQQKIKTQSQMSQQPE
jgi:hypothetical protein